MTRPKGPETVADDPVGDHTAGQGHEQPDRLMQKHSGHRCVGVHAIHDEHPGHPANRARGGGQGIDPPRAPIMYAVMTTGMLGTG